MKRMISLCAGLSLLALPCFGNPPPPPPEEQPPLKILASNSNPFIYLQDHEWAGYEYAILLSFAESLGRPLEVVAVERNISSLLDRLEAGEGDLAAAALTITEKRQERFGFTTGHFPTLIVLVEPQGEESEKPEDLIGKTVVTLPGSTYEARFDEIGGVKKIYRKKNLEMFQTVASGEADALAVDSPFFLRYGEQFPELLLTLQLSGRDFYGFALRKEDADLRDQLDAHIEHLKKSGRLKEIVREVFGDWAAATIESMGESFFDP